MAKALLITNKDLLTYTSLSGNIDTTKITQYIGIAQDIHIQSDLGTDLLEKIQADIISSGAPSGDYLTLVNSWVKPALIHWTAVEMLPMLSVTVGNGGIFQHTPENGNPIPKDEVDSLVAKEEKYAKYYSERLRDYLCNNSELFPEYNTNANEDINPSKNDLNSCNWVL